MSSVGPHLEGGGCLARLNICLCSALPSGGAEPGGVFQRLDASADLEKRSEPEGSAARPCFLHTDALTVSMRPRTDFISVCLCEGRPCPDLDRGNENVDNMRRKPHKAGARPIHKGTQQTPTGEPKATLTSQ